MTKPRMMYILLALALLSNTLFCQNKDSLGFNDEYSKLTMRVSLGILPIAPKGSLINNSGKTATLELLYHFSPRFFVGGFATNMIHYESYELVLVDDKVIDLSSSEYGVFGLSLGYKVVNSKRIAISPELKGGLSLYNAKSIGYAEDNKSFINKKSMVLNPNLTIAYKFSEKFQLGLNGGYQLVVNNLKGSELEYFNPSTLNYGLSAQLGF
jgi:hypothetical protein